jgi:hypothetical protein
MSCLYGKFQRPNRQKNYGSEFIEGTSYLGPKKEKSILKGENGSLQEMIILNSFTLSILFFHEIAKSLVFFMY